ncbi:MAG: hypothetical protein IJ131_11360 [Eggerthellaceae bacterium]|nr:hypothetical protein [Eggerthellaceae bacterium]
MKRHPDSGPCAEGFETSKQRPILRVVLLLLAALCVFSFAPAAFADEEHSQVAETSEMAAALELGVPGMEPIEAHDVKPGTYSVEVESSSAFFKIVSAQLSVDDDSMEARITLRSSSYTLVYPGTGELAAAAPASDYIPFNDTDKTFTIPVEALDDTMDCAAFSKNRRKWYDRKLLFRADSLPDEALLVDLPSYDHDGQKEGTEKLQEEPDDDGAALAPSEPVQVDVPDGEYSIEVDMTGGSGRAQESSPTWLEVEDGRAWARLLWSSPYYDYMVVGGTRYDNQTTDGSNSTFRIPITALDEEIDVVADTTAMGDPVEIDYHLTFYSATIGEKNLIPQEAAILVLELALAIIVVGGILNYILKKRRKQ